jgi:GINS complex subunit 4
MVEQPDFDKAVFVRALVNSDIPVQVPGTDIDFELRRGGVYVVRWNAVRDRVEGGEMELV